MIPVTTLLSSAIFLLFSASIKLVAAGCWAWNCAASEAICAFLMQLFFAFQWQLNQQHRYTELNGLDRWLACDVWENPVKLSYLQDRRA